MIDVAVVGLGKMGLSHLSIMTGPSGRQARRGVRLDRVPARHPRQVHRGARPTRTDAMLLDELEPHAVIIATPTHLHARMIREALERGIHVFCEKPFVPRPRRSRRAGRTGRRARPGHPGRLPQPVRRCVPRGQAPPRRSARSARVTTALAEAYGPVVLKPAGRTWRSQRDDGRRLPLRLRRASARTCSRGTCGAPQSVSGSQLDQHLLGADRRRGASTLHYPSGTAQLIVELVGRVAAQDDDEDHAVGHARPDLRRPPGDPGLPARHRAPIPEGYRPGWNVRYTTELTEAPSILPARRGVQRPARRLRPRAIDGDVRGRERLRLRRRHRPRDRDDQRDADRRTERAADAEHRRRRPRRARRHAGDARHDRGRRIGQRAGTRTACERARADTDVDGR